MDACALVTLAARLPGLCLAGCGADPDGRTRYLRPSQIKRRGREIVRRPDMGSVWKSVPYRNWPFHPPRTHDWVATPPAY